MTPTSDRATPRAVPTLSVDERRALRAALAEQRAFRVEQLRELEQDPVNSDETLGEVRATLSRGARFALAEIDAALERLGNGEYGRCLACRAGIPLERLEILPMAALCTTCQRSRESGR